MIVTIREFMTWIDMSILEMWLIVVSVFASTVLLMLKLHGIFEIPFMIVFWPMFGSIGFCIYFQIIVWVRGCVDGKDAKKTIIRFISSAVRLSLLGGFVFLLATKIGGELDNKEVAVRMSYSMVFTPLWSLFLLLAFQVCRATNM